MIVQKHLGFGETEVAEFLTLVNEVLGGEHSFTEPVDLIFVGTCSHGHGRGYFQHTTKEGGHLQEGHFKPILERNPNAKTILLVGECCGQYRPRFQEELRKEHPEINWLFPDHRDYCERTTVENIARDLIDAGVLS